MMHHFFPKFQGKFAGVTKEGFSSSLFVSHVINGIEQESLNVSVLLRDFLDCIPKLKKYLEEADESLLKQIVARLKDLDKNIEVATYTTCTTVSPGAPQDR